jgi:hypothetical protein
MHDADDPTVRRLIATVARATRSIEEARWWLAQGFVGLTPPRKVVGADGRVVHFPPMPVDPVANATFRLADAYEALDLARSLALAARVDVAAFDDVRARCAADGWVPPGERAARQHDRLLDAMVCVAALRAAAPHLAWDEVTEAELADASASREPAAGAAAAADRGDRDHRAAARRGDRGRVRALSAPAARSRGRGRARGT